MEHHDSSHQPVFGTSNVTSVGNWTWDTTDALSLALVVGSSLSLVGLIFTFITYSLFSDLRTLAGTTLMNLFASLFLSQLLFVVGVEKTTERQLCFGLAFTLHYLYLTVFFWLAAMTHDLYITFRENVNLNPVLDSRLRTNYCRYTLISWGLPAVLVGIALAFHYYHPPTEDVVDDKTWPKLENNCWMVDRPVLLYFFAIPVSAVTLFSAVYFAKTAIVIHYVAAMQLDGRVRRRMIKDRRLQLCLYLKLYAMAGSLWLFGLVAVYTRSSLAWIGFQVLFSLQGVFVAIAYTCNGRILRIYAKTLKTPSKNNGYGTSKELSRSTSLQLLTWEPQPDAV